MNKRSCIFVYGQSIFIQAITSGLEADPDIELHTFDPHHPLVGKLLRQASPTLVIIEVGGNEDWLMGDLLSADTPILVVNVASGYSKLLTGRRLPLKAFDDHGVGNLRTLVNQIELIYSDSGLPLQVN